MNNLKQSIMMHLVRSWRVQLALVLVLCASLFPGSAMVSAQESSAVVPALRFFPYEGELLLNQPVELQVRIFTAGEQVDAADARFTFTPNMISITDGEGGVAGINLQQGTAFPSVVGNAASTDDTTGVITAYNSAAPLNTDGGYSVLATVLFTPTALGELTFTFDHTLGSTTDSNIVQTTTSEDILAAVRNARFTVVETAPTPTPTPSSEDTSDDTQAGATEPSPSPSAEPSPALVADSTTPTSPDDLPISTDQEPYEAPVFFDDPAAEAPAQPGIFERLQEPAIDLWNAVVQNSGSVLDHWVAELIGEVALPLGLFGAVAAAPMLSLLSIMNNLQGTLRPKDIPRLLDALGFLPSKKPAGMVFDAHNYRPVPFALLTLQSSSGLEKGQLQPPQTVGQTAESALYETVIADVHGVFHSIQLPPGSYQLLASQGEYRFPTAQQRPIWLSDLEYYRGEAFAVAGRDERRTFLVPMDAVSEHKNSLRSQLGHLAQTAYLVAGKLFFPSALLATVIYFLFPTVLNGVVLTFYAVGALQKSEKLRRPRVTGQVIDEQGRGVSNALVRLMEEGGSGLAGVTTADDQGRFAFQVEPGRYQVLAQHTGYTQLAQIIEADAVKKVARVRVAVQKLQA